MKYEPSILRNPAGTFHFVGSGIPGELAYVSADGSPATETQLSNAAKFGPKLAGVKTRTFPTRAAAVIAGRVFGLNTAD